MHIQWDDEKFSVGHKTLDDQHKKIITMINEFSDAISADIHSEILHDTLQNMLAYAQDHLSFEETVLSELGYNNLDNHAAHHASYLEMVSELTMEVINENLSAPVGLQTFLIHWWENHILVEDMAYKSLMLAHR